MMQNTRIVITVDGCAASGKTALASHLAKRLGFAHMNSGLLYRAVGLLALNAEVDLLSDPQVVQVVREHSIGLDYDKERQSSVKIDGVFVGDQLNTAQVSQAASKVASLPQVRTLLLPIQREAFPGVNLVAEGRDMGTVVFPDAALKFFVEADLDVRTQRRYSQLSAKGASVELNQVKHEIEERDKRDASRDVAPMKPAEGAVIVNNSQQPFEEVLNGMYDKIRIRGILPACDNKLYDKIVD